MIVIKRNGQQEVFNQEKIYNAVDAAVSDVYDDQVNRSHIASTVTVNLVNKYQEGVQQLDVEQIQDDVETELMKMGEYIVAREYIKYRYERALARNESGLLNRVRSIVEGQNESAKQENANKSPVIGSTQRDYMAGEVSKEIAKEILPADVWKAHKEGVIHFHDADYFGQKLFNCCLINLGDMLQNGCVISGTLIERPHSFSTACNIATQIIAQVASNQYGGQTITLADLAPFVDISRQKIRGQIQAEYLSVFGELSEEMIIKLETVVESRVKDEVRRGVQTIQYQVITLMTTNGQAPFITVWMYIDEVPEGQLRDDLAMIIEEVIKQRYEGVKNEKGAWITTEFPKLIYCLDEDNITPDSKYWHLTELAAKCSAKRLVPDYVSAKVMKKLKLSKGEVAGEGDVYPPMGCRSFLTPDRSVVAITEDEEFEIHWEVD